MSFPYNFELFDDLEEVRVGGPKAGIVVVTVTNFVVGALLLIWAGLVVAEVFAPVSIQVLEALTTSAKLKEAQTKPVFDVVRPAATVMNASALVFGVLCLIAGIGTALRSAWGRILSLVLGLAANLIGLAAVAILDLPGILLFGSYSLLTLLILRDKDYSRQYR